MARDIYISIKLWDRIFGSYGAALARDGGTKKKFPASRYTECDAQNAELQ